LPVISTNRPKNDRWWLIGRGEWRCEKPDYLSALASKHCAIAQPWHRGNADQAEGDQNKFRLIVDFPISVL
jgi:hypothetical protein